MSILVGSASLKTMLNIGGLRRRGMKIALRTTRSIFVLAAIALFATSSQAAEVIPPKPPGYFQDNAGVVSKEAALRFNEQLAQFERETSNQVVVAVFLKMESDSDVADYTRRIAEKWDIGRKRAQNAA